MAEPTKTTRRDFLRGQSAAEALADAVIGQPEALPSPVGTQPAATYLLSICRDAMACEFEVLLRQLPLPLGEGRGEGLEAGNPAAEAAVAALDLVEQLEGQLTIYRETSEIMAINRRAAGEAVPVEPGLFALLQRAVELFRQTGGAFDITSGPLSKVWGFYRRQGSMPDAEEVRSTLALVGSQFLELDGAKQTIRFQQPGIELNLGAIGKGYALDRAADVLAQAGATDFLIHGGNSSVLARGSRQIANCELQNANLQLEIDRSQFAISAGWSIALRHPLRPEIRLVEFRLVNQALGTSGSGTQFFHYQGRRYGHILDPRTGWPAEQVLSATVIAPTAEQADALSTAFYVLGLAPAQAYCAAHPEISALLVTQSAQAGGVNLHPINLRDEQWRKLLVNFLAKLPAVAHNRAGGGA